MEGYFLHSPFFEIDKHKESEIISVLNDSKIRGVKVSVEIAKEDPKMKHISQKKSFNKGKRSSPFKNKKKKSKSKRFYSMK